MVYCVGHSIISPLGEGSQANLEAVHAGRSGLKRFTDRFPSVEPFCASLFDTPQSFVPLCIKSVELAVTNVDLASSQTVFVLSTTKGDNLDLWTPAQTIARHFGNPNKPIVVSNACTSGVCAQITAKRLLDAGLYRLSPEPCLPFSPDRKGLNLGEAAATMVLTNNPQEGWRLEAGSIHNDANHISAPSRTGEGAFQCLQDVLEGVSVSEIALLGVHGTATLYNDDMEKIAIQRAGLENVPVSALKPVFGHTMGAAGVLETIICALQVQNRQSSIVQSSFIKMLSGFGGVNAAVRWRCE